MASGGNLMVRGLAVVAMCVFSASDQEIRTPEQTLPSYQPRLDRARPVIAVVGHNEATELTDYVVPYAVLAESGVAEVMAPWAPARARSR
jgi:hypothetical protein